jgi:hypothetical protein
MAMTSASRIGYWSALTAFVAATGYGVVQILQLTGGLTFPWDEVWIFGFSICIAPPFVLSMVALHRAMPEQKRIWTSSAIAMAIMYATLVTIVYPTQLAVVIPARLAGNPSDVQFLMVTPHTFMWLIDGAGYLLMGLSTLFAAGAFAGTGSHRWLRWFLIANGLLDPLIIAIYIFPALLPLGSLWLITAPGSMLLLARFFRSMGTPVSQ